jgi:hypothetical protein
MRILNEKPEVEVPQMPTVPKDPIQPQA